MLLPQSQPRRKLHTRTVTCIGYQREDGLWDIEGHLTDIKTCDIANKDRGGIPAGEPIHGMWLRVTVDLELRIVDVTVAMEWHPKNHCPEILGNFDRLRGLQIRPGFTSQVRELLGGINGCTHMVELIGPVATTAYQTMHEAIERKANTQDARKRPMIIDTCHVLRADGPVVRERWPEFYEGPEGETPAQSSVD